MDRAFAPFGPRPRPGTAGPSRWIDALVLLTVAAFITGMIIAARRFAAPMTPAESVSLAPSALPGYAWLSTLRMAAAYLLSLGFSLVYARVAVASRAAERVLIPLLDVLQSIPILSFMPGLVLALVALFPHSNVGLELAAVLLIFTSQAWNLAFGFYQSLLTIPREMHEAAMVYRLNAWQRFARLELPFGTIALVWNSMMSWAGGWFFLMASEQFTLGDKQFQLPGVGSYLQAAANAGDVAALLLGLAALIAVIVLLDQLFWRPMVAWSERFRLEQTGAATATESAVLTALRRSTLLPWLGQHVLSPLGEVLDRLSTRLLPAARPAPLPASSTKQKGGVSVLRRVLGWGLPVALIVLAAGWGVAQAIPLLAQLSIAEWGAIGVGALATLLRTTAALSIGAVWTIPLGVLIGLNRAWARRLQPLVQLVASIPATALFPALLLLLLGLPGGLNIAAVALMLLGTQWYILFNVIAGAMAIPTELQEAAVIYKLTGWRRWRSLILPAIFPYLITGLLTATGGAWNASIVSEYVSFGGATHQTIGLGALIAQAAGSGNFAMLLGATLAMALVVVALNRLVWRRLHRLAVQRYRLE